MNRADFDHLQFRSDNPHRKNRAQNRPITAVPNPNYENPVRLSSDPRTSYQYLLTQNTLYSPEKDNTYAQVDPQHDLPPLMHTCSLGPLPDTPVYANPDEFSPIHEYAIPHEARKNDPPQETIAQPLYDKAASVNQKQIDESVRKSQEYSYADDLVRKSQEYSYAYDHVNGPVPGQDSRHLVPTNADGNRYCDTRVNTMTGDSVYNPIPASQVHVPEDARQSYGSSGYLELIDNTEQVCSSDKTSLHDGSEINDGAQNEPFYYVLENSNE